jgi:HPt (histidine-containing phosphotransfer) domain-containing protein
VSIHALLAELQKNYLAALPEKVTLIEDLWKDGKLDLLRTEYHKLKGTGRTYGLPEITQIGAALERLCESAKAELVRAVPMSTKLLRRIGDQRTKGETPVLDHDPDFQAIVAMVEALPKSA